MESYGAGVRRRMQEGLKAIAQVVPTFVIVAYLSSVEKALIASTVIWSLWVGVSARKGDWRTPGFWWIVGVVGATNAVVIWLLPDIGRLSAGIVIAYPIGMAEGFGIYWLLGWWVRHRGPATS